MVVNAHPLYEYEGLESTTLLLVRADGKDTVDIVGPIAISATFDLGLLETAKRMPHYLRIAPSFCRKALQESKKLFDLFIRMVHEAAV